MSFYLLIVIAGLIIKSTTATYYYFHCPKEYAHLRVELFTFFSVFISSSIVNIFIFAPSTLINSDFFSVEFITRLYYVIDNLATLSAAFLLLGMFKARHHRSPVIVITVLSYIAVKSFSVLFTDRHFQGIQVSEYMVLAKQVSYDPFLMIPQTLTFLPLGAVVLTLVITYRNAKTNQSQIHNFYALIAFILYYLSYIFSLWTGLDEPSPLAMSTRGFFFFFVICVTLLSKDIFDIRHITPKTVENETSSKLRKLFRDYTNEHIGHKDVIREMEKIMVEYKITKTIGFKDDSKSALPIVANSMKMSRSGLYDVLKRLGIKQPNSK